MQAKKYIKILLLIATAIFLIFPIISWYFSVREYQFTLYFFVRPIGLYAFTFLSFYLMIDLWGFALNKIFNPKRVENSKNLFRNLALFVIFIHPTIYFISYLPSRLPIEALAPGFVVGEYKLVFALAALAFYSLLAYVILKFILKHKKIAEIFIYMTFFFAFTHSFLLGSEIGSQPVIYMWPVYMLIVLVGISIRLFNFVKKSLCF